MSKVSVFEHGWIDLVFEGRNQQYGAYQLRKQDAKTTILALVTGIALMVTLVSIPVIINFFKADITNVVTDSPTLPDAVLVDSYDLPKTLPATPEPIVEPAGPAVQSNIPTTEFKPLAPTSETTNNIPTTDDFAKAPPSGETTLGEGTQISLNPGTAVTGPATGTGNTPGEGTIESFVDVAPLYPGGLSEFYKDVANRFRTPDVANATTMKVFVSFVVEPDGTLSNIKATRDPGYGMGAEAVRVLKSLKAKWTPGKKSGKAVRTAYNLPITVKVN